MGSVSAGCRATFSQCHRRETRYTNPRSQLEEFFWTSSNSALPGLARQVAPSDLLDLQSNFSSIDAPSLLLEDVTDSTPINFNLEDQDAKTEDDDSEDRRAEKHPQEMSVKEAKCILLSHRRPKAVSRTRGEPLTQASYRYPLLAQTLLLENRCCRASEVDLLGLR